MESIEKSQKNYRKANADYARGYKAGRRKGLRNKEAFDFTEFLTKDVKDVVIELIRASMSNPLMGIFVSIAATDILVKLKVLTPQTAAGLYVAIGAIEGAEVAGTVINDFASVFKIFGKSPSNNTLEPSLQTFVEGADKDTPIIGDKNAV